jgi:CubicO group peptidase (beta-lactamase class C family)
MFTRWNRLETWLALGALGVGALLLFVGGLFAYMRITAHPLFPNIDKAPQVAGTAAPAWQPAIAPARTALAGHLAFTNVPGISVAVGTSRELLWTAAAGVADLEAQTPLTPEHRFRIGSASLMLTATAIGRLVDQGTIDLDAEIQKYVPEFPKKPWPVTLRQVLAHTSGLKSDGGDESPLFGRACERPVDALTDFATSDLRVEPDTAYRFSMYGGILASAAIETVADQSFLSAMQALVFTPAHMDDTLGESSTKAIPHRSSFSFPRFAADTKYGPDPMRELHLSCYAGANAFLSTPADLVRFGQAVMQGTLLTPATRARLHTPQRLRNGSDTEYGLGWDLATFNVNGRQVRAIGHNGNMLGGPVVAAFILPDDDLVVAVATNESYSAPFMLAELLAEIFLTHRPAR